MAVRSIGWFRGWHGAGLAAASGISFISKVQSVAVAAASFGYPRAMPACCRKAVSGLRPAAASALHFRRGCKHL